VVRGFLKRSNADTLIVLWMSIVLIFFTLVQTRIYWYILPAYPAFAIAIGSLLYQIFKKVASWHPKIVWHKN